MKSRLFRKYFLAFIAILLFSFTFLGTALLGLSMNYWTRDKLSLLSVNVKRVADNVTELYSEGSNITTADARRLMLSSLLESNAQPLEADFFLCDIEGVVVACREDLPEAQLPSPVHCAIHSKLRVPADACALSMNGNYTFSGNPGGIFEMQSLLAAEPFMIAGKPAGFVMAVQPVSGGMLTYVGRILQLFLISGMAVLLLTFAVVYFISYRLVRPLQDMIGATQQYARGEFGYRVKTHQNNELRQLAEAFNSMAISLATLESSRRSFVANVSHELKTPMTSIGGFIDGMLDGTIPQEQHRKYLTLVSEEVRRLSRLVTGMLNLSKIEAGELQLNVKPFDISELLFTTLLSFEQIISRKAIELVGLESLESVILSGDKDMLTQVVYNLTDNAVKFTPERGTIQFFAQTNKESYYFALRNSGAGVSSEELAHIFERFYKIDKSRSFDVKGAGLGLYLARTIVKMHGGQISAESDGESYTQFMVQLPLHPPTDRSELPTG